MKNFSFSVLLFALLFVQYACAQVADREFKVQKGKKLTVHSEVGGNIKVSGWDKENVSFKIIADEEVKKKINFAYTESAEGVKLVAKIDGDKDRWRDFDLTIEVSIPNEFDADLKTSGGNIALTGVSGQLKGKTSGGNILLKDLKGKSEFFTSGGNISLNNVKADGAVKTSGGNISLSEFQGNMDAATSGGNISINKSTLQGDVMTSGGNISFSESESTGDIKTSGGNISVDKAPKGVNVATSGGNISVNSAKSFVISKTSGGNISIEEIDGSIDAKTSGGNIHAKMTGDPKNGKRDVEMMSSGGKLTLYVPADLDMNIEIETSYSERWGNKKPEIVSDFPVTVTEENQGDKVKMYGKGKTGSGQHSIKLKTAGGSVYLKKS